MGGAAETSQPKGPKEREPKKRPAPEAEEEEGEEEGAEGADEVRGLGSLSQSAPFARARARVRLHRRHSSWPPVVTCYHPGGARHTSTNV